MRLPILAHVRPSSHRGWTWPLVQDFGISCFSTKPSLDPSSQAGKGLSLRDCELWVLAWVMRVGVSSRTHSPNPVAGLIGRTNGQGLGIDGGAEAAQINLSLSDAQKLLVYPSVLLVLNN